ncbi:hypothetical protein ACM25N_03780 [Roseovarius sp. C7]|uniref:hypothetical protein n=1 Tax=Roseovarius sp. C7 TaxID=3398643 RepID=UPI0039F4F65F
MRILATTAALIALSAPAFAAVPDALPNGFGQDQHIGALPNGFEQDEHIGALPNGFEQDEHRGYTLPNGFTRDDSRDR